MEQLTIPPTLDDYTRHRSFFCTSCDTSRQIHGGDSPLFFRDDFIRSHDPNGLADRIDVEANHNPDAVYCEVCGVAGDY